MSDLDKYVEYRPDLGTSVPRGAKIVRTPHGIVAFDKSVPKATATKVVDAIDRHLRKRKD